MAPTLKSYLSAGPKNVAMMDPLLFATVPLHVAATIEAVIGTSVSVTTVTTVLDKQLLLRSVTVKV